MQSIMFCAGCGVELPAHAAYCPACGRRASGGPPCSNCGAPTLFEAEACSGCGHILSPRAVSAPSAATLLGTPVTQFNLSVGEVYGYAWAILRKNLFRLFAVYLIAVIIICFFAAALWGIYGLIDYAGRLPRVEASDSVLSNLINPVLYGLWILSCGAAYVFGLIPVWAGIVHVNCQASRSRHARISDFFMFYRKGTLKLTAKITLATFLSWICILLASYLLIIPGIVVALRLSFVILLIVDEGYGPVEAIFESWRRTVGFWWTLFGTTVMGIPVFWIANLLPIVGAVIGLIVINLTTPTLFIVATGRHGQRQPG
jgi:hypothetical protein